MGGRRNRRARARDRAAAGERSSVLRAPQKRRRARPVGRLALWRPTAPLARRRLAAAPFAGSARAGGRPGATGRGKRRPRARDRPRHRPSALVSARRAAPSPGSSKASGHRSRLQDVLAGARGPPRPRRLEKRRRHLGGPPRADGPRRGPAAGGLGGGGLGRAHRCRHTLGRAGPPQGPERHRGARRPCRLVPRRARAHLGGGRAGGRARPTRERALSSRERLPGPRHLGRPGSRHLVPGSRAQRVGPRRGARCPRRGPARAATRRDWPRS